MALDKIEECTSNQIVLVETATSHHKTANASGDASMLLSGAARPRCAELLAGLCVWETDNRSTPEVQRKGLTRKWPLFGVQMSACQALRKVNKRLLLNWRPRDENT